MSGKVEGLRRCLCLVGPTDKAAEQPTQAHRFGGYGIAQSRIGRPPELRGGAHDGFLSWRGKGCRAGPNGSGGIDVEDAAIEHA
jgi:hypothetical protein